MSKPTDMYPEAHERDLAWLLLTSAQARDEMLELGCLPKHFSAQGLRGIAEACVDLHTAGLPVTESALSDRDVSLDAVYSLHRDQAGIDKALLNVPMLASRVVSGALLRALMTVGEQLQFTARRGDNPHELINETKALLEDIELKAVTDNPTQQKRRAGDQVIERLYNPERFSYLSTGIPQLTRALQMEPGMMIILAGRPGMGKSALALNIAAYHCLRQGGRASYHSYEMKQRQLVGRTIQWDTGLALNPNADPLDVDVFDRKSTKHRERIEKSAREIEFSSLVFFDDWSDVSVEKMRADCRRMKRQRGLDLIVVDYVQLMTSKAIKNKENKRVEVDHISRELKRTAGELDVPVIVLAQLNRGVEQRANKRPMLSDLKESGSLEQDADVVAFLYRDDYYLQQEGKAVPAHLVNVVEVNVAKKREGATGRTELSFCRPISTFAIRDKYAIRKERDRE